MCESPETAGWLSASWARSSEGLGGDGCFRVHLDDVERSNFGSQSRGAQCLGWGGRQAGRREKS